MSKWSDFLQIFSEYDSSHVCVFTRYGAGGRRKKCHYESAQNGQLAAKVAVQSGTKLFFNYLIDTPIFKGEKVKKVKNFNCFFPLINQISFFPPKTLLFYKNSAGFSGNPGKR